MPRTARPSPRTPCALLIALAALASCHGASKSTKAEDPALPTGVATLAAFDPAGVGPGEPPKPGPSRPLDVVDYGPQGRTEGNGELHIRFNQPVVALDLADSAGLEKLFKLDPPLPGRAYWKTPDLLVYELDAAPLDCHAYTVRFTGGLVGLDGQRFDRALTWSFETPRPTVVGSDPESRPRDPDGDDDADIDNADEGQVERRDSVVLIHFDRPVALKQVQAHVQAVARPLADLTANAKPVPVRVRKATKKQRDRIYYGDDDRHVYAVQARTLWPGSHEVEVSVTAGLVSEAGPLPLDTPWSMVFRTYSPQALLEVDCPPDDPCGLQPISLRLRNPVSAQQIRKITLTPKPRYFSVTDFDDWGHGGRQATLTGHFVPGTTYTVHVPTGMRDIYGQTIAGGATRQAVIAPRATLALSSSHGILPATGKQTIGVESRHVKALHVRAGIFTDAEVEAIGLNFDASDAPFPARVLERDIPLTVTGKGDWSSLAIDLADLTGGARRPVLLEVSAADLVPRADEYGPPAPVRGLFRLTDLGPVAIVSLPASSVQVLRLSTGAPVPKARVSRFDPRQRGKLLDLGLTDANGLLALPGELVPLPPVERPGEAHKPAKPLRLTVSDPTADDRAHLDLIPASISRGRHEEPADEPSAVRPGERLIARFVSERGVYRPGEKVRVVGWSALDTPFSRSNLGRVKTGTPVVFRLIDPTNEEVSTQATRTTSEGKFWAELAIPAQAGLGRYSVRAKLLGEEIEIAVKVEDYRVPEYTVEATARSGDILAGEKATIDVHASYYFGGPVQIQRLSRATRCQYQHYRPPGLEDIWVVGEPSPSHNYHGGQPRVVEPTPALATPGRRTVVDGSTLEDPRYPQRCTTSLEVQDASMQGIGAEAGFSIHPAAVYLALAPPRGYLEAGQRASVPARAVDIQGKRVAADEFTLEVDRHWRERSYKPEGGQQVFAGWVERSARVKTCKPTLAATGADPACALPTLVEGRYELRATAREPGSTRVAHTFASFQVYPKSPPPDPSWRSHPVARLEVLTDRSQVKPGETVAVAVRSPWPDAHGTLVVARGGIRETLPIALAGNEQLFKFTADDTWTPSVAFQATIVQPSAAGSSAHPQVHDASAVVHQGQEHRRLQVVVTAPP
ncbi:MAG TPA: MG2 domain-containing protein, partial [Nannocystis sp.]